MDQDSIQQIITETMKRSPYEIDWTPILWLAGAVSSVIGSLLVWIGILLKSDRANIVVRTDKHEIWILAQQKELNDMGSRFDKQLAVQQNSLEYIAKIQDEGRERLRLFEEHLKKTRERK